MKRIIIYLLTLSLFLVGCGGTSQPAGNESASEPTIEEMQEEQSKDSDWKVGVTELGWPDPDLAIQKLADGEILIFAHPFRLDGSVIWRTVATTDLNYENQRNFVQKLEAPYTEWEITEMAPVWEEAGQKYGKGEFYVYKNRPIYTFLAEREVEHSSYFWATCDENGEIMEKLDKIPEHLIPDPHSRVVCELVNPELAYIYQEMENMLYQFSKDMKLEKEIKLPGQIESIVKDRDDETVYICGHDDKSFVIWDTEGKDVIRNADKLQSYEYHAAVLSGGEFVLCDEQKLWVCDREGNAELVYNFVLKDYPWELIYDIEIQSDDKILVLGVLDDVYVPIMIDLKCEDVTASEKQEIVIAFGYTHKALLKSVSRFNRQSDKYHISAITAGNGTMNEFSRKIQSEISAGRGPDILADDFLGDISGYIANGYFAPLDGVINEEEYLKACIEGGKTDGVLYGLPYDFMLRYMTYSEEFAGNREFWTVEELMSETESSGAKQLAFGCDAIDIIMWFGLYDNDNTDYIDWENRESHLSEEPFRKLLRFAAKYGDEENEGIDRRKEGGLLLNGDTVAAESKTYKLLELYELEACFKGNPAYLGYPRENGKGIYAQTRYLYLNTNSVNKEGVKEFFRFLVSNEEQQKYCKMEISMSGWEGYAPYLPVNLDAFENLIEKNCHLKESEKTKSNGSYGRGVAYAEDNLTDEQIEDIRGLLSGALPDKFYASSIYNIVSEELSPYIKGQRSMEEAIRILDNRVQLYLDEQK